jgi:capsular exopolysaccharide synthesis family protein
MATNEHDVEIDFSQYIAILSRRRWVVVLVSFVVFAATAAYVFLATPIYRASTLLNIEKATKSIASDATNARDQDEDYFDTQFKLITSNTLLERIYADLNLAKSPDFIGGLQALREAVAVAPVPHTHLCYVSADSQDPLLAMKISLTLTQYYVEQNLHNQLFMSKDVLDALQMRMHGVDAQKINESLPTVVNNRLIQSIKEQIFTAEAQLADLRMKYTDNHPAVVSLRSRLESMKQVERNEIENIVQSLKTDLSGQLQGNNVRIVDPAKLPESPVRPRKLLALIFGALGGLSLGAFMAIFIEFLDQTVRTQDDVEKKIGLPFLGVIPYSRHKKRDKVFAPLLTPEMSLTSEAFRNLRTMVGFAEAVKGEPAFLVTSTVQEEGKSYVTAGLSVVLAQLGQKVLVVDGDLRRPRQHRNFHASAEKGLSDYLAGIVHDPAELLQRTEVPNLDIITCGPRPPNPADLLNTDKLASFVHWARQYYARVIIDCTPVFPISDALLWGRVVKPAIFVMRFGRTRGPLITTAVSRLRTGGLKLLGGVVNGARVSTMSYADGRYYEQYYRDYADPEPPQHHRKS